MSIQAYASGAGHVPTTVVGWLALVFSCYVRGMFMLFAAAGALILAGFQVRWPEQHE